MSRRLLDPLALLVFLAGLAVVGWIGLGYVGGNPLGAAVALLIGACYLAGAAELLRYRKASATLAQALADTRQTTSDLPAWLARLPAGLRHPVRLRIEGERAALPAPALTPYLVGLLVLLGMLGTLLGMMATLRGTGLALESATDLDAIRGSLAAPVRGLGLAFGTSIAGVAASAALGLLSTLCRRERLQAVQRLDAAIATTLRVHSHTHQREQAFALLQRQTELMPALVDRLQAMASAIETQGAAANAQLQARQEAFHAEAGRAYGELAASVGQSLEGSIAASSRAVGAALQPVIEATLAGMARESAAMREAVSDAVQRQLDGIGAGFETATARAAETWTAAHAGQQRANAALAAELREALERATVAHERRAGELVEQISARLAATVEGTAQGWNDALARQEAANDTLAARNQAAFDAVAARLDAGAEAAGTAWREALAGQEAANAALAERNAQALDAAAARFAASAEASAEAWNRALSKQDDAHATLAARTQEALAAAAASFERQAGALVATLGQSHAGLQAALESRDGERLGAWSAAFESTAAELAARWAQTGEQVAERQQAICAALARTADEIASQARAHAGDTIAEVSRLVQTASEAPRAAAEVVAELRQSLSESMVRDTAMLEERTRLLATLETLLDAVNHASTEQRTAVDALVSTSADLLERVGSRFSERLDIETGRLAGAAAEVTGSAVEVASLGDAFGAAVEAFGASSAALGERLQHIAGALDASLARSDEQLAYYVAQAREVVDLSVLSQKQIIEELQRVAGAPAQAPARPKRAAKA
ncbi:DUF802 domain-containing protein [Coralloluteibacterium stylophorae]|uniref:DUF802 domain-containing protein n=2 Tax=Coralloluteibacterium stylophorae TaxID=1776034 RepID=A0AAP2C9D2_9GAMM|nr:DUF802 domain-containing protein [Coralloluteibacterium stylophorae]MBS7456036.1 DUF802 domain-containing protein [Coralloluteibacterium stylophorae]